VNLPLVIVIGGLSILTLWGLVAPRSQWRTLSGWSTREGAGAEPAAVLIRIHRLVAGVAVAALVVVGLTVISGAPVAGGSSEIGGMAGPSSQARAPKISNPVRLLWGAPDPAVVNRVFVPVSTPSLDLTRVPVLRYQSLSPKNRSPAYLFGLNTYARPYATTTDGYLGADPTIGFTALDTANIVVQVRADSRCVPQQVLVVASDTAISLAVYYGRPVGEPLDAKALAAPCDQGAAGAASTSVLIPIDLGSDLGGRAVLNLEGTPISRAQVGQ
jgi:hypothetical protein